MKKLILLFAIPLFLNGYSQKLSIEQSHLLWNVYKEQNYFRLHHLISGIKTDIQSPEFILFKAKLNYVFNKPQVSDSLINILLNNYSHTFNDSIMADLHLMKAVNSDRLENYKSALTEGELVVGKYRKYCDSTLISETKDDNEVREVLADIPRMKITRTTEVQIPIKRDIAGLINLPVALSNDSINFVFDTGANISVMIASVAKKYGVKILPGKVHITAITGKRLDANMALADIKLGSIEIKNSVFIIFPDSVLTFANGAYIIKGIVGFPIMNALKETILKEDKFLIIPQVPESESDKNFALDQSNPVIQVTYKNDTLPFHFDTGADKTELYASFLGKYNDEIVSTCKKKTDMLGGAGGIIKVDTYVLDKAMIIAGDAKAQLNSLGILTKQLRSNQKHLFGNFGQDFMKQFKVMKINFSAMHISFSN